MPASIAGASPTGPRPVGAAPSALLPLGARLRRTATRFAATDAAAGLVLAAAAAVGLWTLACAAEALLWLPSFGRVLLDVLVAAPVGWIVATHVARPLLQRVGVLPGLSDADTARRVGGLLPGVGERIGAALDLVAGRLSGTSTGLAAAAARALEGDLAPVPFERAARFDAAARHARRLWPVPLVAALALAAAPGPMTGASARLLSPLTHATRPAPFALAVAPGDVTLAAGDTLVVRVDVAGRVRPAEVVLELRRDGEDEVEQRRLTPDAAGRYHARVPDVRAGLRYRIVALPVESAWHRVTVVARPSMAGLQVTVTPPAYARQATQTLADGTGDVAGLPGTRVAVAVRLDGSAREAFLVFDDGSRLALAVRGAAATGAFTLRREGTYRVVVRGAAVGTGAAAETEGPDFRMTVLPDAPPSVAIVAPGPDAPFTGRADLDIRAADDYGLARAVLFWRPLRLAGGDSAATALGAFRSVGLSLPAGRRLDEAIRHAFAPRVGPGEGAEYYVQVWDNNAAGAQTARTPVYRLRRAGADEALRALDTAQAGQDEALEQTEEAAERLRLQSDETREALREGGDAARRAADSLAARQRQFEQQAERLATEARDVAAEMQRQNASPESQQAQRQMQRTLEELNDPDLRRALEEMQRALEQNDTPRAQQAYERYEQRAQDLRERLEQARAIIERFRLQQQIESAAQQAAALEERQRDLAEEARRVEEQMQPRENETAAEREAREEQAQQAADDLARQQQAAAEEARRFEEQLRQMQEQGQRTPGAPRQQMEEVRERAEQNAASRPMEEAGERLDRASETPPQQPGEQQPPQSQQGQPPQQGQSQQGQPPQGQQTPPPQQQRPPQSTPGQSQQQQGAQSPQQPQSAQQRQMQQAQAEQQEAQRQLEWYRRQLQQMGEQMQSQKESVNAAAVRKALDDVLRLSTQQEALRLRTQRSEGGSSPVLRDAAGRQADLAAGLRTVADTLGRIARRAPIVSRAVQEDVGEALREMTAAQQRLTQRQAAPAAAGQRAAMTHLNELALKLTQMLDNALSGSPSGGQSGQQSLQQMLQQLQQMSGQQQGMNDAVQQMLNEQQGERLRPDAAGQAQRMARQQAELRRELRQMSRNPESRGRMLDELEEAEQQMDEVRRELERGRVSRPMQERQRQILSRLLEATRSLQQRGEDDRREGRRPGAVDADGPRAAPPPPTPDEQLRRDLLRALDADYTPETERLIRRYLERLRGG